MTAGTVMDTDVNAPALVFDSTKLGFFREERFLNVKDTESDSVNPLEED